jgi:hypothetical protein
MATLKELKKEIRDEIIKVTKVAPFKHTNFGTILDSPSFPSLNFNLIGKDHFDEVSIRPSGMLLRWELTYEVHVLYAVVDNQNARIRGEEYVDQAEELFLDQMPSNQRLNNKALYIETSNTRYGIIELETGTAMNYIDGGIFTLTIQFLQEKDT